MRMILTVIYKIPCNFNFRWEVHCGHATLVVEPRKKCESHRKEVVWTYKVSLRKNCILILLLLRWLLIHERRRTFIELFLEIRAVRLSLSPFSASCNLASVAFDFRVVLARSLKYCQITVEKLKHAGIEVMWHGKKHNEGSHYCFQCEVSSSSVGLHVVFCSSLYIFLDIWEALQHILSRV